MDYLYRLIQPKVQEFAKYFKAVLIVGARQVGKSTLLQHLFPEIKTFVFDPVQDLYGARQDPDLFLNSFPPPLILDEIQYVPELIPALKRKIDESPQKGQYFLTGSQNLSMLKTVAESMAGRVGILQLEGLTPSERDRQAIGENWLFYLLENPPQLIDFARTKKLENHLPDWLWRGGMPGLLDLPNHLVPSYFQSYIQTYIERDVRLVENIRELTDFDRFIRLLGALTAQEINSSQLGRDIGISPSTAKRWLDLLSNTYQWIELPPYSGNTVKRISGKSKGYLRDTGLACFLQRIPSPAALLSSPLLGPLFETWGVNAFQRRFNAVELPPAMYHWRTASGSEVDLILEWNGRLYPIEMKCKTNLSKGDLRGIQTFMKTYGDEKIAVAGVVYAGHECYWVDQNVVAIPWRLF